MSGSWAQSFLPAVMISARDWSMSKAISLPRMARLNSCPVSVPMIGVSKDTPAHSRCFDVNVVAEMVTTPTRFPGGRIVCTQGTCKRLDDATGTATAAAAVAMAVALAAASEPAPAVALAQAPAALLASASAQAPAPVAVSWTECHVRAAGLGAAGVLTVPLRPLLAQL